MYLYIYIYLLAFCYGIYISYVYLESFSAFKNKLLLTTYPSNKSIDAKVFVNYTLNVCVCVFVCWCICMCVCLCVLSVIRNHQMSADIYMCVCVINCINYP